MRGPLDRRGNRRGARAPENRRRRRSGRTDPSDRPARQRVARARPERRTRRSARKRGSGTRSPVLRQRFVGVLGAALLGALLLVSLRIEILRLRYDLAGIHREEQALLTRERELTAEVGQRRDPARLRAKAAELGFALPEQVIQLDDRPEPAS